TVETDLASEPSTFELGVQLIVEGEAACMLALDPASFDDTIVGTSSEATATVTNAGTDACELTGASASGPFAVEGFEATSVAPGASYDFTVVYSPTSAGDDTGTLTVETGNGDLTAALSGTGLDEPTPEVSVESLTINVPVGGMETQSFTLSNEGGELAADLEYAITVAEARPGPAAREAARETARE